MSLLSNLFKSSKKTDLSFTPPPQASSAPNYSSLGQLAGNAIRSRNGEKNVPGIGFGEDYVNKSTNPIAQGWMSQYNQETAPRIEQNFSSRGLGKSTLAANAQNQAFSNTQNQIDQLMANFYQLNETQKKSDENFGIQVGQNQDTQFLNQGNQVSAASERLADSTNKDMMNRQTVDTARAQNIANTAGQGLSMFGGTGAGQGLLSAIGLGPGGGSGGPMNLSSIPGIGMTSTYGSNNVPQGFQGMSNPGGNVQVNTGQKSKGFDWGQAAMASLPMLLALL